MFLVCFYECLDSVDFLPAKPVTVLQADRFQPELGLAVIAFNMNMRRFVAVTGIEEKSIRTALEYSRHCTMLRAVDDLSNSAKKTGKPNGQHRCGTVGS